MRLVTSFVLAAGMMFAQAGPEKAIRRSLDQFSKAVVGRDQATLSRLIADSVVYSHSNGNADTKASFIGNVMSQKPTYEAFELGEQTIRFFGRTATVRGKITVKDLQDGQRRTLELSVLQVWVRGASGWQLVERQSTRLNP
jgi:ketosteroid isomerase-like protein